MKTEIIPKIIITDTHFGRKNNSINFLRSQMTFFDQLIQKISKIPVGTRFDIVHCGDIFESRSTVGVYILDSVMDMFRNMIKTAMKINKNNRLIFVAGNHDFYSPVGDTVNTLDALLSQLAFEGNVITVSKKEIRDPEDPSILYVPWFRWNNNIDNIDFSEVKVVFTHTDLHEYKNDPRIPQDTFVLSGHIHGMRRYRDNKFINIPTPYGLDFSDVNDDNKGAFILNSKMQLKSFLVNTTSIKFRRIDEGDIYNIKDLDESIERGDNYNIYLSSESMSNSKIMAKINELRENFKYINIIPVSNFVNECDGSGEVGALDIEDIIRNAIPEHLKSKFDEVIELSSKTSE